MGVRLVISSPAEHDRLVAAASHLPQLLSTALAAGLEAADKPGTIASVSGPGLLDMTRLALSSHEIWKDILSTNGDEIAAELERMEARLAALRGSLTGEGTAKTFAEGRHFALRLRPGHDD